MVCAADPPPGPDSLAVSLLVRRTRRLKLSARGKLLGCALVARHGFSSTTRLKVPDHDTSIYDIGRDSRARIAVRTSDGIIEYAKKDMDIKGAMEILTLLPSAELDDLIKKLVCTLDNGGQDGSTEVSAK